MKKTCGKCNTYMVYENNNFGECGITIPAVAEKLAVVTPDFNAEDCFFFERRKVTCADCENFDFSKSRRGVCTISLPVCVIKATASMLPTQNATYCTYFMER